MKRFFHSVFMVLLFFSLDTVAFGQVDDSSFVDSSFEGVEILEEPLYTVDGHDYGSDFYVSNNNGYSVCVTIRITESSNIYDGLVSGYIPVIVEPNETVYLGWVVQSDISYPSNWFYEWEVSTDCLAE